MISLATGAEMRVTGSASRGAVVCDNGGQAREVDGTWSASVEWLVRRLSPSFPDLAFGFSMGDATAIAAADKPSVEGVVGLAPWIPDQLDLTPMQRVAPR